MFSYRYPLTKLDSRDDYLKITFLNYVPPGFGTSSENSELAQLPSSDTLYPKDVKKELGYVMLPIPDDIRTSNTAQWGQSSINPLAGVVAGLAADTINDPKKFAASVGSLISKGLDAARTAEVQKAFQAAAITLGTNVLLGGGTEFNQVFSRFSGQIFNSNIELIFTSVNLREPFGFGFDIVPRSKKEADTIKLIIREFKKHSAAKKTASFGAQGLFLQAPGVFRLEYMNGGKPHPYLNRFKICACNGVGVNYTGSGTYATYDDATPVNMQLTLSFQELTPIYAEDYDTTTGQEATGY